MKIYQSPTFFRFIKKLDKKLKSKIDEQIKLIAKKPDIGEQKKGDLQEVRVIKFKYSSCLYLLAYRYIENEIQLIMIPTHENFYRDLKKYVNK